MLKFMLETRGPFRVITASTKETALKVFDTWRVDLALLEFPAIAEEIYESVMLIHTSSSSAERNIHFFLTTQRRLRCCPWFSCTRRGSAGLRN
jgi:hypothetical protein